MIGSSLLRLVPQPILRVIVPRLRYFDLLRAMQLTHVEAGLPRPLEGQRLLEVGTGNGLSLFPLLLQGAHVMGVDTDARQIEVARRVARALGFDGTQAQFQVAALASLPLRDRSVDVVIAGDVLTTQADEMAAFKELGRLLRPGGLLALTLVAAERPAPWWRRFLAGLRRQAVPTPRPFDSTDLRQKLELIGFEVIDSGAYLTGIGSLAIDLLQHLELFDRRTPGGRVMYALASLVFYLPAVFSDAMGPGQRGYGLRVFAVRRSDIGGPPQSNGNGHGRSLKYTVPLEQPTHAVGGRVPAGS